MKEIKHRWIKILGRRVHTSNIVCYIVKMNTTMPQRTTYPWKLVVYFDKEIFDRNNRDHIVDYLCTSKKEAQKMAKKLDKIFKPE